MRARNFIKGKLLLLWLMSSLAVVWGTLSDAHEVQPAIADLEQREGRIELTLDLTLEAFIAGIKLDGLIDTNDADGSDVYDQLRTLPPGALSAELPGLVAQWRESGLIRQDGASSELQLDSADIPEVGNPELPRVSKLVLSTPVTGEELQIAWPSGSGDMVLRQQGVEDPFTGYLSGGTVSPVFPLEGGGARSGWGVFAEYIPVGFDHIIPKGLDHILFVLGLFFLNMGWRALLWQVTAFTAAHTVTLALGAVGWVNVPGSIVEPLIAASIVYVAVENIFAGKLSVWRPALVFAFGLLHGLGFASVLGDFGLPEGQFIPALLGFNVGVELGQLAVIAIAFVIIGWAASRSWYRGFVAVPASCLIALVGAYWVIERTLL